MRCEERNHCQSNKCQNGAICINEATDEEPYRCECPFDQGVPTFYGKYCQFDVDECKRDPCQVNLNPKTILNRHDFQLGKSKHRDINIGNVTSILLMSNHLK